MNRNKLLRLIFMALCCDYGLFSKRLIAPAANIITDAMHIPGGIGTSFSLLFLVVAAALLPKFGSGTIMGLLQGMLALSMGMVGSMGILSPIGYVVPGFIIDCVFWLCRHLRVKEEMSLVPANMLSAVSAGLIANLIVFRLRGVALLLYAVVALTSGAICGVLARTLYKRIQPILCKELR